MSSFWPKTENMLAFMKLRLFRNNLRPYAQLWYNEPIDYDCGVADRKGSLNRRCLLEFAV